MRCVGSNDRHDDVLLLVGKVQILQQSFILSHFLNKFFLKEGPSVQGAN